MSRQNGYAYRQGEGLSIVLRGTTMHVKVTQEQSLGTFSVIEMAHPPKLSIPLHVHPRGHEAFYVLDGSYRIRCGEEQYESQRGDFVFVPKGLTHNYEVGPEGGRLLVVSPPGPEKFFYNLARP